MHEGGGGGIWVCLCVEVGVGVGVGVCGRRCGWVGGERERERGLGEGLDEERMRCNVCVAVGASTDPY
jgi:hypothetical protein